ncbi:hypothetical protein ABBQ32_005142 [Trebouxia sp. C0010 RCD-2024]
MGAEDSLSGFGNSCNGSLFNPATSEPSSYSAGAALVALVAYPAYLLHVSLNLQKQVLLYVVRLILGVTCWLSMCGIQKAVQQCLGVTCASAFMLLCAIQFHLPFYMSRTLPNTFATAVLGFALADWVTGAHPRRLICLLAFSTIVFRCDLLPLAGIVALHLLLTRQISRQAGVVTGVLAGAACLALTVLLDSWFWQRWLWPEGEVLWFNTAQNRSSEWGVKPFHWYFTSALPRALLGAYPLAALGYLLEPRVRRYVQLVTLYIALYSFLPHKEVRFLLPVLPVFNIAAAAALSRIWKNRCKPAWLLPSIVAALLLASTACATAVMLAVSRHNYPGGHAMHELHKWQDEQKGPQKGLFYVHIDVLPAMTGVSRFGEYGPAWRYSKEEGLAEHTLQQHDFTHLLSASSNVTG